VAARAILFDLDGTLVDTRAASWQLFSETNLAFALGIDTRETFFKAFEGNFFDSLAKMVPDPARAAAVKAHFMELLRTRYHPSLIPGMVDVVRALAPQATLAVISTNGIEAIRRILVGAGIATCFSHVFSGDVEPRKANSIRKFIADQRYAVHRMCSPAYHDGGGPAAPFDPRDVVLVTDTVGDVVEAREAGIRAIGVAWGMHSEQQLLDAGAERVALWPQELVAWLRDGEAGAASACACQTGTGQTGASCAAPAHAPLPIAPAPPAHPMAGASRLRREHRMQSRQAAFTPPAAPRAAPTNTPPVVSAELLSAVKRIVGGG
jgi:phosphoglycolate phosphatase